MAEATGRRQAARRGPVWAEDPRALLEVPLRRPFHVLVPLAVCLLAAAAAVFLAPKQYRSSTLILVESEKVPERFVQQMSTETTKQRVATAKQEILSRTRLEAVIREVRPYGDAASLTTMVERMRSATAITLRGNDSFSIDYNHADPQVAMKVADRLATLFIEETNRARERQVQDAYDFIESELTAARAELENHEAGLRLYKERHIGSLPEQMNANLATLQRLQLEEQAVGESLRAADARYSSLLEQIRTTPAAVAGTPVSELAALQAQLGTLRLRYTDEHPEVRLVLTRIARLQRASNGPAVEGDSALGSARGQLAQAESDVATLRAKRDDVERRITAFQARVERAPRTEQDLATLTRDYQKLNDNYLALYNKKLEAQMASKLEERWRGEHFKILDPAHLPEKPVWPKPFLFMVAGLGLGLAAGFGSAFGAESLDQSVKSFEDLERFVSQPILAELPFVDPQRVPAPPRSGRGSR